MRICPKYTSDKILTKIIADGRINGECIDCKDKMGINV